VEYLLVLTFRQGVPPYNISSINALLVKYLVVLAFIQWQTQDKWENTMLSNYTMVSRWVVTILSEGGKSVMKTKTYCLVKLGLQNIPCKAKNICCYTCVHKTKRKLIFPNEYEKHCYTSDSASWCSDARQPTKFVLELNEIWVVLNLSYSVCVMWTYIQKRNALFLLVHPSVGHLTYKASHKLIQIPWRIILHRRCAGQINPKTTLFWP
jgi:hypothetical protein